MITLVAFMVAYFVGISANPGEEWIILYGRTGVGKGYTGNRLRASTASSFPESASHHSCVAANGCPAGSIETRDSWLGNSIKIADVYGYLSSDGKDQKYQADFVDFVSGKNVKSIIFIYTDRMDEFTKYALESLKASGLEKNLCLVRNKVLDKSAPRQETVENLPQFNVQAYEEQLDALKAHLAAIPATKAHNVVSPVSLFQMPIKETIRKTVDEYMEDKVVERLVPKEDCKEVMVPFQRQVWKCPGGGGWCGKKKTINDQRKERLCSTTNEKINVNQKVYSQFELVYAKRFDGVDSIYKKNFLQLVARDI
jgi:hypothetical protein